ncbi:MAG: SRPBCC family protein [Nevskia sp.]
MGQQRVEVVRDFPIPVKQLFAFLSEHENLATIFAPAQVTRVRDGYSSRNGVGSVRRLRLPIAPPFEETVTACEDNKLIEYRISKGSPLKNHKGVMRFSAVKGGSRLHYTIVFEGKLPLVAALVRPALEFAIRKGLKSVR